MPPPDGLRAKLTEIAPELGRSQRRVARVMLEDIDALAYLPANELATRANVHVATVVRLAQRLGFEGYPDLQRSLRSRLSQYPRFFQSMNQEGDSNDADQDTSLVESILFHARKNLDQLIRKTDIGLVTDVARTLMSARRVLVFGIGIAGPLAEHIASSLRVLGTPADHPVDSVSTMQQLSLLDSEGVIFAIDFQRYYRETSRVVAAATHLGTRMITLTDSEISPVAQSAILTLIAPAESPTPRTSLAPAFALAEALIAVCAIEARNRTAPMMQRIDDLYDIGEVFVSD